MRLLITTFLLICVSAQISAQTKFNDTIPFRNDLGLIIIPIKFNGSERQFIFDTGATNSIGFSWVKDELLATNKTLKITSASKDKSRLRYYKSDSVNLGSAKITKHMLLKTDDSEIFECHNIDGILGMEIISKFNWVINYEKQYLVMIDDDFFPKKVESMFPMQFEYKNRRPSVYIDIAGKSIKFLLDTGATTSDLYIKHQKFIASLNPPTREEYSGFFDFNGKITRTKTPVVKLENLKTDQVTINGTFDYSKKSSKLGNTFWKNNVLFLSAKSGKLYSRNSIINETKIGYGCFVLYQNKKMIVSKVLVDSDVWQKGVRQGDEIAAIDDKVFTDLCALYHYQREASQGEKDIVLTLKNGDKVLISKKQVFK